MVERSPQRRRSLSRSAKGASHEQTLRTLVALSADLSILLREEELVARFLESVAELVPDALLSVRLLEVRTSELALVHATGHLLPSKRETTGISRAALAGTRLDPSALTQHGIVLHPSYETVFADGIDGFDVALCLGGLFFGVVNVESTTPGQFSGGDREAVRCLAQILCSALRNAQVLREAQYLREYLEKLLEHANAAILVVSPEGRIQVVNRTLERILGRGREDLWGKEILSLVVEGDRARFQEILAAALRGKPGTNEDVRLERNGGTSRLTMNVAPIVSLEGEVEGLVAIGHDLTEVRSLQERVIHQEKLATLGQFAAGIVHELNNPLTSIAVYADFLIQKGQRSGGDSGDLEKIRRIAQGAERILHLTRDLMSYARPSTEEPSRIDLNHALDQALVFCEPMIERSATTIVRSYGRAVPPILAVETQIHQVLINLITNACQAMEKGKGRLLVGTRATEMGEVIVTVEDNGCGIQESNLESIFEPFFTTKEAGQGTGLGLSIVKNIIRSHDGTISVSSEPGRGTTFEVVLRTAPVSSLARESRES